MGSKPPILGGVFPPKPCWFAPSQTPQNTPPSPPPGVAKNGVFPFKPIVRGGVGSPNSLLNPAGLALREAVFPIKPIVQTPKTPSPDPPKSGYFRPQKATRHREVGCRPKPPYPPGTPPGPPKNTPKRAFLTPRDPPKTGIFDPKKLLGTGRGVAGQNRPTPPGPPPDPPKTGFWTPPLPPKTGIFERFRFRGPVNPC